MATTVAPPIPNNLEGGGPPDVFPGTTGTIGTGTTPYYDQLYEYIEYMNSNPGDLQAKLNFVEYLQTLNLNGVLSDPNVISLLQTAGYINANGTLAGNPPELQTIIQEGSIYAMFDGYTAQAAGSAEAGLLKWTAGETLTGPAAAFAFIADMQSYFSEKSTITPVGNAASQAAASELIGGTSGTTGTSAGISQALYNVSSDIPNMAIAFEFVSPITGTTNPVVPGGALTITEPDGSTVTYDWLPTDTAGSGTQQNEIFNQTSDQAFNQTIINDFIENLEPFIGAPSGSTLTVVNPTSGLTTPVTNFNTTLSNNIGAVTSQYKSTAVSNLIAEYGNNIALVFLFFMTVNDNTTQLQLSALSNTTKTLNNFVDTYVTPLTELTQKFGSFDSSAVDSSQYIQLLYSATAVVNAIPELSSISSSWNTNVFNSIVNTNIVTSSENISTTLGDVMEGKPGGPSGNWNLGDATNAFNSFVTPDAASGSGTGSNSTQSPAYQAILSALQQGAALATNQSQVISTQVGTLTQNDSQYLSLGSAVSSSTGGGIAQLLLFIVGQYASAGS